MRKLETPTKTPRNRVQRGVIAAALAGALLVGGGITTAALSQDIRGDVHHYWECFGWMITDPATHAANCLPGRASGAMDPASYSGGYSTKYPSRGSTYDQTPF